MRVLVGMRVWLCLGTRLLLFVSLFLLGFASSLLSLLLCKLLRLDHSFHLSSLLEVSLFLGILFLLFEFLLGCCSSFGAEILQLLFLFRQLHLSLLLLKHCLHLSLLHAANVSGHGAMADSRGEYVVLSNTCPCHHTEVGRHVVVVQNVALYARLLVLSLLAPATNAAFATWAPTWALSPILLSFTIVVV